MVMKTIPAANPSIKDILIPRNIDGIRFPAMLTVINLLPSLTGPGIPTESPILTAYTMDFILILETF
jgi:hypothetical protein